MPPLYAVSPRHIPGKRKSAMDLMFLMADDHVLGSQLGILWTLTAIADCKPKEIPESSTGVCTGKAYIPPDLHASFSHKAEEWKEWNWSWALGIFGQVHEERGTGKKIL